MVFVHRKSRIRSSSASWSWRNDLGVQCHDRFSPTIQTCTWCTLRTSGISRLKWRCKGINISETGAPSTNSLTLSFGKRRALRSTSTETRIENRVRWRPARPDNDQRAAIVRRRNPANRPSHVARQRTFRFFHRFTMEIRTRKQVHNRPATAITIIRLPATGRGV